MLNRLSCIWAGKLLNHTPLVCFVLYSCKTCVDTTMIRTCGQVVDAATALAAAALLPPTIPTSTANKPSPPMATNAADLAMQLLADHAT